MVMGRREEETESGEVVPFYGMITLCYNSIIGIQH